LLTFTCSVVCLLPQAYSNKLRLAALEAPVFHTLWCLAAQRTGMVIKMKRLPKYTPADVRNDPYGFTYKEMTEVIGENEAKALYEELYKQLPRKKNLSMLVKNICKSSDTEKYVYELKDNKYIETVFIKRRDGGTVCVSTQVGCPVGCIFCESGRNGFVRNLTSSEIVQQIILLRRKVNRIVFMGMGEPLFNYDNLIKAIHILRDRYG